MSNPNLQDQNYAQAVLTHAGQKQLGPDAQDATAVEVRRAGVQRMATRLAIGVVCVFSTFAAEKLISYGIDHSPTVVYQRELLFKEHQGLDPYGPNTTQVSSGQQGNVQLRPAANSNR